MRKFLFILSILFFIPASFYANQEKRKMTPAEYIDNYKNEAIEEMFLHNIPASITLAQGMLESDFGNSDLAVYANNHFGIKCHKEWNGPTFMKDDDAQDECFRKYPSVLDSYTDHSNFLKSRNRYAGLFELKRTDYRGWAKGLKDAGYATHARYTERLLELIENYRLHKYDYASEVFKNETDSPLKKKVDMRRKSSTVTQKNQPEKNSGPIIILRDRFVKYVVIRSGDTFEKIAMDTDKDIWQLYRFNDLDPDDKLIAGEKLFIQPKRNKAREPFHIVKKGETMRIISQLHGIKLKSLYKKNNMKPGAEPKLGEQLFLRNKKPTVISKH